MARYEKTEKRGHGCCGGIFTFLLVCVVAICLLAFSTDVLDSVKTRALKEFFPQHYSAEVEKYSAMYGVDETLVYSVIRTESGFRAQVQSHAGAVGLMQIMPETFEWLQNMKDGSVIYTSSELTSPEINIEYGTYFLSYLLEHYDGNEMLAVAAYNAGMTNVDNWLMDEQYSHNGITLSEIPYNETSQYVERVEKTKAMYESLYYDNN